MSNATQAIITDTLGGPPFIFALPVDAGSKVFRGTLVSQLTATGMLVPYSTASTGVCVGVAQHDADNSAAGTSDGDKRCRVETMRAYALDNGAGGDAFSEASLIGAVVYASDDHTVADNSNSQAYQPVGFFMGMESDGKVRVFIFPPLAKVIAALQALTNAPATADALRDEIVAAFG